MKGISWNEALLDSAHSASRLGREQIPVAPNQIREVHLEGCDVDRAFLFDAQSWLTA